MEEEKQEGAYRQLFKEFAIKRRNEVFLLAVARTDSVSIVTGKKDPWAWTLGGV